MTIHSPRATRQPPTKKSNGRVWERSRRTFTEACGNLSSSCPVSMTRISNKRSGHHFGLGVAAAEDPLGDLAHLEPLVP